jgi:hypothetical protein
MKKKVSAGRRRWYSKMIFYVVSNNMLQCVKVPEFIT